MEKISKNRFILLNRQQLKRINGGNVIGDTTCWDQCETGVGQEFDCQNGMSCVKVPTPGCTEPYVPKKCVPLA
jgi:hypothetical protein